MSKAYHRVLLLFADGVGLAPAGPDNPLAAEPTPAFDELLGGSLTAEALEVSGATEGSGGEGARSGGRSGSDFGRSSGGGHAVLAALDAALGVPGLPQSATGQTALFTGVNAPAALGRHVTAFPGPRLRAILEASSLFRRTSERGFAATFANPFTPGYFRRVDEGGRRLSATTLAAVAGGVRLRGMDDLHRNRAVAWDVERDRFAERAGPEAAGLRRVSARDAGEHLAALAAEHRLTLYETFYTDLAGHRRWGIEPADAVRRLDGLVGGLREGLAARPEAEVTVVLTSDHGNLEDATHTVHTTNPVPLLAFGPAAERFRDLTRIDQVAGRILDVLTTP